MVTPTQVGMALAALIAGPPLYSMVRDGTMDSTAALERGAVVAVACAVGAGYVGRIIAGYEEEHRRAVRLKRIAEFQAEEAAAARMAQQHARGLGGAASGDAEQDRGAGGDEASG